MLLSFTSWLDWMLKISVWMSLLAFLQRFYEKYGPTASDDGRIFRHGLLHGTQPPPNEQTDVLRLFHAIDTVTGLMHKS